MPPSSSRTKCAAWYCAHRLSDSHVGSVVHIHRFPRHDTKLRATWELAVRAGQRATHDVEGFKARSNSWLCSDHFEKWCYDEVGEFKSDEAVPTLFYVPTVDEEQSLFNFEEMGDLIYRPRRQLRKIFIEEVFFAGKKLAKKEQLSSSSFFVLPTKFHDQLPPPKPNIVSEGTSAQAKTSDHPKPPSDVIDIVNQVYYESIMGPSEEGSSKTREPAVNFESSQLFDTKWKNRVDYFKNYHTMAIEDYGEYKDDLILEHHKKNSQLGEGYKTNAVDRDERMKEKERLAEEQELETFSAFLDNYQVPDDLDLKGCSILMEPLEDICKGCRGVHSVEITEMFETSSIDPVKNILYKGNLPKPVTESAINPKTVDETRSAVSKAVDDIQQYIKSRSKLQVSAVKTEAKKPMEKVQPSTSKAADIHSIFEKAEAAYKAAKADAISRRGGPTNLAGGVRGVNSKQYINPADIDRRGGPTNLVGGVRGVNSKQYINPSDTDSDAEDFRPAKIAKPATKKTTGPKKPFPLHQDWDLKNQASQVAKAKSAYGSHGKKASFLAHLVKRDHAYAKDPLFEGCEPDSDPYRLRNRITEIQEKNRIQHQQLRRSNTKMKKVQTKLSQAEQAIVEYQKRESMAAVTAVRRLENPVAREVMLCIIRNSGSKHKLYTDLVKDFCKVILDINPKAYGVIRHVLNLPIERTLKLHKSKDGQSALAQLMRQNEMEGGRTLEEGRVGRMLGHPLIVTEEEYHQIPKDYNHDDYDIDINRETFMDIEEDAYENDLLVNPPVELASSMAGAKRKHDLYQQRDDPDYVLVDESDSDHDMEFRRGAKKAKPAPPPPPQRTVTRSRGKQMPSVTAPPPQATYQVVASLPQTSWQSQQAQPTYTYQQQPDGSIHYVQTVPVDAQTASTYDIKNFIDFGQYH